MNKRRKYTHESTTLNDLLGHEVAVKFLDGSVYQGLLARGDLWGYNKDRYRVDDTRKGVVIFYKSHIASLNGRRFYR